MTTRGIGLVARQEIKTRLRTGRWKTLLAVWFVIVNGLGVLFGLAVLAGDSEDFGDAGVPVFGGVLLGVLVLTLLITPALGGQSINGDRERGTLAPLQVTRLAPGDIALGKLAAAWGTGVLTLLLTLPCALWPVATGAVGPGRAAVVLGVIVLLIGVVCAVSQAWSALLTRSITSVLMSYLTVFGLLVGTPLLYSIGATLTAERIDHGDHEHTIEHTERVWWLLAPNPVVVLADAAPRLPERQILIGDQVITKSPSDDPLGSLSRDVREIREGDEEGGARTRGEVGAVWPYGLLFSLALGAGAVRVTTSRLRTPLHRLPKSVRVA